MLDIVKVIRQGNPVVLSPRLKLIYENLLPGKAVWDFCCDHGYLGIEALKSRSFSEVYFVDQVPHIVQDIETLIQRKFAEQHPQAHFKICKGEDVDQDVCGTVVIAGVGAFTIFKILQVLWQNKNLQADRLILCPQRDEQKFMELISNLGSEFSASYSLNKEWICHERKRRRHIYILDRSIFVN